MPRYPGQNLAAINPEYRKANNIDGNGGQSRRYTYGKKVFIASGSDLFANGFTIRFLPVYDESAKDEQGGRMFVNFREGNEPNAFGDWGRLMTCAHWVGNPGVCFIVHDGNPALNPYDSPYHILRNVAYNNSSMTKRGLPHPMYGRMFDELLSKNFVPKSHVGSLRKPEPVLFVSASAVDVDVNGQPTLLAFGRDEKKDARVIGLKKSCAEALYSALEVRDESTGEPLAGDMLSFEAAKLVTFVPNEYNSNSRNSNAYSVQGPTGIQIPKKCQQTHPVIHGNCMAPSNMTYRAVIHDSYNGQPVSLEPYVDQIVADTKSWDEYLYIPSYVEQAELLATAFDREILRFAWQEHPEYLRMLPSGTTTVEVGDRDVDDLHEADVPPAANARPQFSRPVPQSVPVNPRPQAQVQSQAPQSAELPEAELSAEDEAGVNDMFAAARPAPQAPPAAAPRPSTNVADIIARAKAKAARGG